MPSPWKRTLVLKGNWRCQCNRIVSNKLKSCDKCGRERKLKI